MTNKQINFLIATIKNLPSYNWEKTCKVIKLTNQEVSATK